MANPRGTFAKRNREMKLKDRAREKQERRNSKPITPGETKGPQIAWDQPGGLPPAEEEVPAPPTSPDSDKTDQ